MSQAGVRSAGLPEKHKLEATTDTEEHPEKCSQPFVLLAAKIQPFPSNQVVKNQFTAETAINPGAEITGKT
jgi:hypothetical protein